MVTKRSFFDLNFLWLIQLAGGFLVDYGAGQPQRPHRPTTSHYPDQHPPPAAAAAAYRCSGKLEDALDNMVHRNQVKAGGSRRTQIELTPYSIYHSLYGNSDKLDNVEDAFADDHVGRRYSEDDAKGRQRRRRQQHAPAAIDKIEVAELRVRLPANTKRWVVVDKCQFSAPNRTLDTRLLFPDLTISGRVILHPSRGHCNMILRLRRAGIEFRTTPLDSRRYGESRVGTASVRTDSHFAEPGFLSVFAHGCQGPSGLKYRQNSKRNRFDRVMNGLEDQSGETTATYNRRTDERNSDTATENDALNFDDEILDGVAGNGEFPSNYGRSNFDQLFASSSSNPNRVRPGPNGWSSDSDEIGETLSRELEQLFSVGIRGLLTTYMQKTLQPAIKETLMENMGYVLSYG